MKLDSASPALQRAVRDAIARGQIGAPARGSKAQRDPSGCRLPTSPRAGGRQWRCGSCGELSTSWAAAQRHADAHGGGRVEIVL